jgi:hypothetical protein
LCTALRPFQRDAPVVAVVRHPSFPEERQRGLDIAAALAMDEGIADEIACGRGIGKSNLQTGRDNCV